MKKLIFILGIVLVIAVTFSCSKSEDNNPVTPPAGSTPGPKFLAVKSVMTSSCALSGCHVSPANRGGVNLETDANIVAHGAKIKVNAVDNGTMPPAGPLSAADKAKITDWINAGGRLTD